MATFEEEFEDPSTQQPPVEEQFDSSNPKHVGKIARESKSRSKIQDDGFRELISSPQCRAWIWALLSSTNVFASTFSLEPAAYGLKEGQRSVGLGIMSDIQRLCPEMLATMMRENQEKAYG